MRQVVTKANKLIQAAYKLTLNEQRLVLLCICRLDPRKPLPRDNKFTVLATEFADTYGIDVKNAYTQLEDAANRLYERDIRVIGERSLERFRWVFHVKYHEGEGYVDLAFSPSIVPYLTKLHAQFTSFELRRVSELQSAYSIRIFEILMQYKSTGRAVIKVDDFRKWLELGDKYSRFSNLVARVINPGVNELNAKSQIAVEWRPIKKGRTVDRIEFVFKDNPQLL